jgi:hypothetical protein
VKPAGERFRFGEEGITRAGDPGRAQRHERDRASRATAAIA